MTLPLNLGKLGRYGLCGGTAALVDMGVFGALTAGLAPVTAAAAAAFGVAALVNYGLTSRFVFRQPLRWRRLGAFLAFAMVGASVNVGVTSVGALALGAPALLAKAVGIGAAFLVNYWMNAQIVFRAPARAEAEALASVEGRVEATG